jgi:transcriptional regulator with XRE-family HTH domain
VAVNDEQMVVAGRLSAIRKMCELSQKRLSELSGVDQSQLSGMETGRYRIQIDILMTLAEKYNVNVNWLLTGKGEKILKEIGEKGMVKESNAAYLSFSDLVERLDDLERRLAKFENSQ